MIDSGSSLNSRDCVKRELSHSYFTQALPELHEARVALALMLCPPRQNGVDTETGGYFAILRTNRKQ